MNSAYVSILSALGGTLIGGLTSFLTAWITQHAQAVAQRRATERTKRENLYGAFIDDISRLFAQALSDDKVDYTKLVGIYAKRGRIELLASKPVSDAAMRAIDVLMDVYMSPTRSPVEVREMLRRSDMDVMRQFAAVARIELQDVTNGRVPN